MPPIVFFIGMVVLIGVIAAYVILELARPYPDKKARIEREKKEQMKAKRRNEQNEVLDAAAEEDDETRQSIEQERQATDAELDAQIYPEKEETETDDFIEELIETPDTDIFFQNDDITEENININDNIKSVNEKDEEDLNDIENIGDLNENDNIDNIEDIDDVENMNDTYTEENDDFFKIEDPEENINQETTEEPNEILEPDENIDEITEEPILEEPEEFKNDFDEFTEDNIEELPEQNTEEKVADSDSVLEQETEGEEVEFIPEENISNEDT